MRLQLSVLVAILLTVPVFTFGQGGQATPGVAGASTDRTGVSTRCRRSGLQDNNLRTITFGVDLAPRDTVMSQMRHVTNRITGDVLYDDVHGSAQYLYRLPARSTRAVPQQLPELRNRYHRLIYRW